MKTVRLRNRLEYLLIICIIIDFNTPYLFLPGIGRIILMLTTFILLTLLAVSNISVPNKTKTMVFIYWIGSLFPMIILREHNYLTYIIRYVFILPLLWMYLSSQKKLGFSAYCSLFFKYSNVVVGIAVVSLIMWLLGSILHVVSPTILFPYNWTSQGFIPTYWGIYFETQFVTPFGGQIWRNTGIFNEGPMYNMVLCIAFSIEYFIRPQKSKARLWILAITIFTTLTTTGQLFLIGIGCWYCLENIGRKYRILLLISTLIILYFGYVVAGRLVENKRETGGEGSIDLRTEDIELCIEAGIEHPILGVGLILQQGESEWKGKQLGRSNSLFAVFARGGLFVLILYIFTLVLIPYLYYRKYKNNRWLCTMMCYFLIFTITISYLNYLTYLFMAWGLSNIDMKQWKIPNEISK